MTREEALKRVKGYLTDYISTDCYGEVEEIMKALEQQPCEDCISRQAVDELSKELVHTTRDKADFLCNFWEGLQKLSSVTPKEKTGRWIPLGNYDEWGNENSYKCSECGERDFYPDNYCPNCGAKMIKPQEREDKKFRQA